MLSTRRTSDLSSHDGSGSWAPRSPMVLAHAGCEVTMWARDPKTVEQITTIHQTARTTRVSNSRPKCARPSRLKKRCREPTM